MSHLRALWAGLVAGREDPAYAVACAAVRDLQNGEITVDEASARMLDACDDDEERTMGLFREALEWWNSLSGYTDRNGAPLPRTAARYLFDVDYSNSKDEMMNGTIDGTSRVVIEADNVTDASLLALQMVYSHGQPSAIRLVDPGPDYVE